MRRRLLHFLAIGALLFVTRRAFSDDEPEPAPLRVTVAADASPAEVEAAIDEAALLDLAFRAGWHRTDPVVRDRLIRNMRFSGRTGEEGELIEAALRLGMARRDPVVRRRLIENARASLLRRTRPEPSEAELEAHRRQHPELFRRPGKWRMHQVFVSRERQGERLEARVEAMKHRLAAERPSPEEAASWSDPILLGTDLGWVTPRRLDAALGAEVSPALAEAASQTWTGPLRSTFGAHFFWIEARRAARLPPLTAIRAEVEVSWRRRAQQKRLRTALDRLRDTYEVEVVR